MPHNPFDLSNTPQHFNPTTPMAEEIERHAREFADLGMNPHTTVAMWLGLPNRFTGTVMGSVLEVLQYVQQEIEATKAIQKDVKEASKIDQADALPDEDTDAPHVVNKQARADRRKQLEFANAAWREAIRQRADAMAQWDTYVAEKRDAYRRLRDNV